MSSRSLGLPKQSAVDKFDHLKLGRDRLAEWSLREEHVLFSDRIEKITRSNKKEKRILVVTDQAFYVLTNEKKMALKHREGLTMVFKISVSIGEPKSQFVLHIAGHDDYHWTTKTSRRTEIISTIQEIKGEFVEVHEMLETDLLPVVLRDKNPVKSDFEIQKIKVYLKSRWNARDKLELGLEPRAEWTIKGEQVLLSEALIKVNKKQKEQDRWIMITQRSMYTLDPQTKKIIHMFLLNQIHHLTLNVDQTHFVIHQTMDDDLHFHSPNRGMEIGEMLLELHNFEIWQVEEDDVSSLVVRKKNMKKGIIMKKPTGILLKKTEQKAPRASQIRKVEADRRIDPNDGQPYTQEEFFLCYHSHANWDRAAPYIPHRIDPNTHQPYTMEEFQAYYGGLKEWDAARDTEPAAARLAFTSGAHFEHGAHFDHGAHHQVNHAFAATKSTLAKHVQDNHTASAEFTGVHGGRINAATYGSNEPGGDAGGDPSGNPGAEAEPDDALAGMDDGPGGAEPAAPGAAEAAVDAPNDAAAEPAAPAPGADEAAGAPGGAAGALAGHPLPDDGLERRYDPNTGEPYTQQEFMDYYGDPTVWAYAYPIEAAPQ